MEGRVHERLRHPQGDHQAVQHRRPRVPVGGPEGEGDGEVEEAEQQLTKESGLLGLSGVSNDVRDISESAESGNANAQLAMDVLVDSIRHWAGSFFFRMGGVEAIVFTAGIGENRTEIRAGVCAGLESLGIRIDPEANSKMTRGAEGFISTPDSAIKVLVIPANEELVVAREVYRKTQTA